MQPINQNVLELFETASLTHEQFKHREHLEVGFLLLKKYSFDVGLVKMRTGLVALNKKHGALVTVGFHETITWFWLAMLNQVKDDFTTFEELLANRPDLLSKDLIYRFYSKETLASPRAKTTIIKCTI